MNNMQFNDFNFPDDSISVITASAERGWVGFRAEDLTFMVPGKSHVELSNEDAVALACHLLTTLANTVEPDVLVDYAQTLIASANERSVPMLAKEPAPRRIPNRDQQYGELSPQAQTIYQHMQRAGSISAREAMSDHGITSAALARRICDIECEGFQISRVRKTHPLTNKRYTRYSLKG